jgi:hypothetical protein
LYARSGNKIYVFLSLNYLLLGCIWLKWLSLLPGYLMLKRAVHIAVMLTLVLLLMMNGISHEFIHAFTDHQDTVDCVHNEHSGSHASFEKAHHHCDFLDLQSPVFLTSSLSFNFYTNLQHNDYFVLRSQSFVSSALRHTALRGPPHC